MADTRIITIPNWNKAELEKFVKKEEIQMEKLNCINCSKLQGDKFTTQYYCPVLNCNCVREASLIRDGFEKFGSGPVPRLIPEVGEDKCPGCFCE